MAKGLQGRKLSVHRLQKGETPFWEAIEASPLRGEWKESIHGFVASARGVPGCEVRWRMTCLVELPSVVPQKTLLSVNRDGSIQLYIDCWKAKDGSTLTEPQYRP